MLYNAIVYEFEFSTGVWTDVSAHVVGTDKGEMGIADWGPLDRVAKTGSYEFSLHNLNNRYTPGHVDCTSGFETGVCFRLRFTYEGRTRTRFHGKIPAEGIELNSSAWYSVTRVTVVDYMEQTAIHEMDLPEFAENKRIDEIVPLIIANMPIAPLATEYNAGTDTFATVFDTTKSRTLAIRELAKVAMSELGYIYVKQSDSDDEVLTVDGRYTRSGLSVSKVNIFNGVDYDEEDAIFDNSFIAAPQSRGKHYYNHIKTITYPRRVDDSAVVLFTLNRYIAIDAGDTVFITGRYIDPDQEAQSVSGINMVTPAATTDYLFNVASDGSGADITADLDIIATYGTNGVEYELTNNNAGTGYVIFLQARGIGVYTYRPVEYEKRHDASIAIDGKRTLNLSMPYQDNALVGEDFANNQLDTYVTKRLVLESVSFIANSSQFLMNAFMDLQVMDIIEVIYDSPGIDAEYFIQSISWTIEPGGIVRYAFGLRPVSVSPAADYWKIGEVGYSEIGETTRLGF